MSFAAIAGKLYSSLSGTGNKAILEDQRGMVVEFDAVIEQSRDKSSVVTKHAVEGDDLFSVSDNVKPDEPILSLKIILSNHFTTNPFQPMSVVKTVKGSLLGGVDDTINDRLDVLDEWANKGDLLKYISRRRTLDNCVITKIGDAITKETGDGTSLSLTLERVNIANAEEIEIELAEEDGAEGAPKKKNMSLAKSLKKNGAKKTFGLSF